MGQSFPEDRFFAKSLQMARTTGNQDDRNDFVSQRQDNLAYRLNFVVILTALRYLEDLNGDGFRLVSSSPGFRNDPSLLRYRFVSHNTSEDVRCRNDPIATTDSAKGSQGSTLQFNSHLLIRI